MPALLLAAGEAAGGSAGGADLAVLGVVLLVRLLLPLLMTRYPLAVIVACLVVDGVDQTVFQQLTDLELDSYQSFDKALDTYYLSIAYLTTLRNWTNHDAYVVGAALLYYRLVGTAIFEALPPTDPDSPRWVLLLFPNTFEYFFIAYEAIRLRWDPRRLDRRSLLLLAAGIWVGVKLPQEYWIHVAQLDTTDLIRAKPWVGVVMAIGVLALLAVARYVVWPRTPAPDWSWRWAAEPLPGSVDETSGRLAVRARRGVLSLVLLEQVVLIGLLTFIFASIFPGVQLSLAESAVWVTALVVVDAAVTGWAARAGRGIDSPAVGFVMLAAVNVVVVACFDRLLGGRLTVGQPLVADAAPIFFVLLLSLVVVFFERCRPVHEARFHVERAGVERQPGAGGSGGTGGDTRPATSPRGE